MKIITQEDSFLMSFFLCTFAMTAITFGSIAFNENPPSIEMKNSEREPASIGEIKIKPRHEKIQSVFLNLCNVEAMRSQINVRGEFIQVRGRNCSKSGVLDEIKIVNNSNGYTASILPAEIKNEYQTDLIQLIPGDNEIIIQYQSPKGELLKQKLKLSVSNRSAAL